MKQIMEGVLWGACAAVVGVGLGAVLGFFLARLALAISPYERFLAP